MSRWKIISGRDHAHPCCDVYWQRNNVQPLQAVYHQMTDEDGELSKYICPRGHSFRSRNPLVIAVESDPDYNSGPICSYCLVDWHNKNVNAELSNPNE